MRIFKLVELMAPVYKQFNLELGYPKIIQKISDYLFGLIKISTWQELEHELFENEVLFFENLWKTVHSTDVKKEIISAFDKDDQYNYLDKDTDYVNFIKAYSKCIEIICLHTKERDPWIQYWLIAEQMIEEIALTKAGRQSIAKIYSKRGIDYFLYYPYGGGKVINFWKADLVVECLKREGQIEEAKMVKSEIENKKNIVEIIGLEASYAEGHEGFSFENLRLAGEKFWVEYFGLDIWSDLEKESKNNLIDSFITEFLLRKKVLSGWDQVVLAMCKCVERELVQKFFIPCCKSATIDYKSPNKIISKSLAKKYESRRKTLDFTQQYLKKPDRPLSLGQIQFFLNYWNDPIMDEMTSFFRLLRNQTKCESSFISEASALLRERFLGQAKEPCIIDLRNASAHPGKESCFVWENYISWLKELLGKPPRRIMWLITQKLNVKNKKIKQALDRKIIVENL